MTTATGVQYGSADVAYDNEILRTVVGSGVHGIAIEGTDDHDEMGVFIEPPEIVLGLGPPMDHFIWRTQPEGHRSGPGDTDRVIYSLRKFLRLAIKGNPTVLLPLFCPDTSVLLGTPLGGELRGLRRAFLSRQAVERFLGYMEGQRQRMTTGKRVPNRPELVEKYGYDCYLDDTEFLTRRGWLTYDGIADTEEIATLNEGGRIEYQRPIERVARPYTGPIYFGRTRYSSWAVTPNHRMWVSKIERGARAQNGDAYADKRADWRFRIAAEITTKSWHQRVAGAPREGEWPMSDSYLALVGAYVSEGCVGKRRAGEPSVLRFEQKDGGRLHAVMALIRQQHPLRTYRYPDKRPVTTWTLADPEVAADVAKSCGEGSRNKRLPDWTRALSVRQSEVLLDCLLAGDGTPYRTGGWVYYTISRGLAGDVQALALSAGHRCNVWGPYDPAGMYQVFIAPASPGRELETFRADRHLTVEQVTDRRIVCFTVPNERLVTRREGRVAMHGNTKYAAHALRLAMQGYVLALEGELTVPLRDGHRDSVLQVKRGEVPQQLVIEKIRYYEEATKRRLPWSPLPEEPDVDTVTEWSVYAHQRWWEETA
jgi:hypothetical protein